ncbi:MAG: hypothetical protein RLZZ618_4208 [Pseudomonadota bacterium]|jgi:SAM-dependent methyltransferase
MNLPDIHLDLGCGKKPRNPYQRQHLCGVDIRALSPVEGFEFRAANVVLDPIPYADNHFGSVSAFDFIEHVPRILTTPDGRGTYFPFIQLMNEVWRVLAPGGRFYALTPTYPAPEVFMDPTHVNVITDQTHTYFCGEKPLGRMYGFEGHFIARRTEWMHHHEGLTATPDAAQLAARQRAQAPMRRLAVALRDTLRVLRGKQSRSASQNRHIYFLWELEAVK